MRAFTHWRWHLDEINGQMHYLWRAVDHEGEVVESFASKTRDKPASLRFEEADEATRPRQGHHDRRSAVLQGRDEGVRKRRHAGGGQVGQQPG